MYRTLLARVSKEFILSGNAMYRTLLARVSEEFILSGNAMYRTLLATCGSADKGLHIPYYIGILFEFRKGSSKVVFMERQ